MPEAPDQKPAGDNALKPLKSTLNLPQTAFPMKAGLPIHEPLRLKQWQDSDLYGQIRRARAGSPIRSASRPDTAARTRPVRKPG